MELGLGCDEAAVRTALSVHEWDNARAVDYLMGSK